MFGCGVQVAGSYENEVLGVGVVVEAVKGIARAASPHVRVELDVQTASGAFSLTFLDGESCAAHRTNFSSALPTHYTGYTQKPCAI